MQQSQACCKLEISSRIDGSKASVGGSPSTEAFVLQNEISRNGCAVKQPEQQWLLKSRPTTRELDALSWLTSVAFRNTGSSPMERHAARSTHSNIRINCVRRPAERPRKELWPKTQMCCCTIGLAVPVACDELDSSTERRELEPTCSEVSCDVRPADRPNVMKTQSSRTDRLDCGFPVPVMAPSCQEQPIEERATASSEFVACSAVGPNIYKTTKHVPRT